MTATEYDYVIIGAGSAGCVLANALSRDGTHQVLILEAGKMDRNLMIHIPAGVYRAYKDKKINWNYQSAPEPALEGRSVPTPRGRVVGGSSSINSMVYMRGHPLDFDHWAEAFGLDDWRFEHCLPYFKAGERSDRGGDEWRGDKGPLGVTRGSLDSPLIDAFLEAGEQSGQGRSEDLNGYHQEGVSRYDATRWNGKRCSAAVAHLHPALKRRNLTLETNAVVSRLTLTGNRVTGLEYEHNGKAVKVQARREIILSGGAINSPQLLMMSGIGPADYLRERGIDPIIHLPGVGQNLQDHATTILQWDCKKNYPIHNIGNPINKLAVGLRWIMRKDGLATSNIWESGGLIRSNDQVAYPNIQYHFTPVGFDIINGNIRPRQAFAVHIDQLRPKSRGQVLLNRDDIRGKPLIQFNYLSHPDDMREMLEGVKKARELFAQPAFDELRGPETTPGDHIQSDAEIIASIRKIVETDYHPCGTCRMGHDDMAVVDGQMRVHGVEGLRVVDASVMPKITSANLNAPTQMIAARAADYILGKAQLAPVHARFSFQSEGNKWQSIAG